MKIFLVSYSTKNYRVSQLLLNVSAKIFGVDKCYSYTENKIKNTIFYAQNIEIFKQKKGGGFWLWKYYIIGEVLKKINENDILVYCDSGILFTKRIDKLIDILKSNNGILLFNQNAPNKFWIKRDCYLALNSDNEAYYNAPQIIGNVQLFQKNNHSIAFVEEVLSISNKDNLITDSPNKFGKPNLDTFIEHRHDQAIATLIAHNYGLKLYPDPTQFSNENIIYQFPNETRLDTVLYNKIFYVHRLQNKQLIRLPLYFIKKWF